MSEQKKTRPRVNLWPRRIISTTALLLVVALMVWGIVSIVHAIGSSASHAQLSETAEEQVESGVVDDKGTTADGTLTQEETVEVSQCATSDLGVELTGPSVTTAGSRYTMRLTVSNTAHVACLAYAGQLTFQVMTGEAVVYDSAQCAGARSDTTALLLAEDTWSTTLTWSGLTYDGCTPVDADGDGSADAAEAGTYVAQVYYKGSSVGSVAVFTVQQ